MRKAWLAGPALAGALALSACGLSNSTHATKGPFNVSCYISPKGQANVHFANNGGQPRNLGSYHLLLTRKNGKALKTLDITFNKTQSFGPGGDLGNGQTYRQRVTYRANTCAVTHIRP